MTNDHFDVLVVDVHALKTIDLLDFVHQVFLQAVHAKHAQNIVRVERPILQSLTGAHAIALLHVDVRAARNVILTLFTIIADDDDFALAFRDRTQLHRAVDFRHDCGFGGPASLKQFDHARQTAGDVFGLRSFARNLGDHVTRLDFFAVIDHQVRAHRHLVSL